MGLVTKKKCLDIIGGEPLLYIKNARNCLVPESNLDLYYSMIEDRKPPLPYEMVVGGVFDPIEIEDFTVKYQERDSFKIYHIYIDWTTQSELQSGYMSINQLDEWDLSWLDCFTTDLLKQEISLHKWRFAKTMPKNPHWYVVRHQWCSTEMSFDDFVLLIRDRGIDTIFKGWRYRCYTIGSYYYWSMGEPVSKTIIINRTYTDDAKRRVGQGV